MAITLDLDNLTAKRAPLYTKFDGQCEPQPAYVQMTADGTVTADYDGQVGGGVPADVWHNRTLRWSVNCYSDGAALAAVLRDAAPLLERIHAGHSVEWDGNNHRGTLTDDGQAAQADLERVLERFDDPDMQVAVWDVGDWLFQSNQLVDLWPAGQTLDAVVAELASVAQADGIVIDGDLRVALLDRAHERFARYEPLTIEQIAALRADGRVTVEQVADYRAETTE